MEKSFQATQNFNVIITALEGRKAEIGNFLHSFPAVVKAGV